MKEGSIILIDKPKGISSFDVIRILRQKMKAKKGSPEWKMGHAGTLDPLASGLMIIAYGSKTKELKHYLALSKAYEADILFGKKTASGDLEGEVLEEKQVSEFDEKKLKETLEGMVGELQIKAPIYSALKKDGKPLYKYAREGKEVEAPIKKMKVLSTKILDYKHPVLRVRFEVGSGTYIRSLAEELGERLGVPATLKSLRRTEIGQYKVTDAEKI